MTRKIEQIARQVHESMPKGIREFGEDVEKKIRQTLQAQLTRLDLVSRENEGDMIFPAETMTVEQMALTIRHGSGIVCLCITEDRRKQLDLPMMVENNTSAPMAPVLP